MVQRDHHRFAGVGIDNAVVADLLADVDGSFLFSLEAPSLPIRLKVAGIAIPQKSKGLLPIGNAGSPPQPRALDGGHRRGELDGFHQLPPLQHPVDKGAVEDIARPGGIHHLHRKGGKVKPAPLGLPAAAPAPPG